MPDGFGSDTTNAIKLLADFTINDDGLCPFMRLAQRDLGAFLAQADPVQYGESPWVQMD